MGVYGHLPHSFQIVRVASKQSLANSRRSQRVTLGQPCLAAGTDNSLLQFIYHDLALQVPDRSGLVKKVKNALVYFRMFPFPQSPPPPTPAGSTQGIFSSVHCEGLLELLEVKLTKVWGPSYDWVPLYKRVVHAEPPTVCHIQFRFSSWHGGFYLRVFCSGKLWLHLPFCLFLLVRMEW